MWKFSSQKNWMRASVLLVLGLSCSQTALAQTVNNNQNNGFYLPQAPRSNGSDEVRSSDGTYCRSAMGGNGPFLDIGAIASDSGEGSLDTGAVYGRITIPLGIQPKRIDCTSLYQLEIERLRMELDAAKAGLGQSADVGWNNQ